MAEHSVPQNGELWAEVTALGCALRKQAHDIEDLRAELDCLIEQHGDKIVRLRADLGNLTEWLFPTETVYPPDSPPEVVDVELVDPYEDAPNPSDWEPVFDDSSQSLRAGAEVWHG